MNLNLTANAKPGTQSGNQNTGHGTRLNSSNFRNVISWHELPSGKLGQVLTELQPRLAEFPRSVPGSVRMDGNMWEFADLHGFFHQSIQIFRDRLYAVRSDQPVRRILDCGAHTGLASLFWYHNFKEARIDAYEADPAIAEILKRNIEVWNLDRVTPHSSAIWTHDRGVNFHPSGDDSGYVCTDQTNTLTPSTHLRSLLDSEDWDLVKMDIEGAEFEVVRDAADSLHRARHWVIEIHQFPHCRDQAGIGELVHLFERAGFRCSFGDFHEATWIEDPEKPPFEALQSQNYVVTLFAWRDPLASPRRPVISDVNGVRSEANTPGATAEISQQPIDSRDKVKAAHSPGPADLYIEASQLARAFRRQEALEVLDKALESSPHFYPARVLKDWLLRDAVFVASYPRSGNTWMRFLLTDLIFQRQGIDTNTDLAWHPNQIIPDVHMNVAYASHTAGGLDRPWMKAHLSIDELYGKILYLRRLPEDSLVSFYYFHQRYEKLREDAGHDLDAFCLRHLDDWIDKASRADIVLNERPEDTLLIRYEDMISSPVSSLVTAARFCGLDVSETHAQKAVDNHEFNKRQSAEKKENPNDSLPLFFRSGKVGDASQKLKPETLDCIVRKTAKWR